MQLKSKLEFYLWAEKVNGYGKNIGKCSHIVVQMFCLQVFDFTHCDIFGLLVWYQILIMMILILFGKKKSIPVLHLKIV